MQEEKLTFIDEIFIKLQNAINPHYGSHVPQQIIDIINDDTIKDEDTKCQKIDKILQDFPGADLNNSPAKRLLPYHVACLKGHPKIAELLINHGADSTKDISSLLLDLFETERMFFETKLKYSEEFILAAMDDLVKSGANINICIDGKSPLERAVRFGCIGIAQLLLERHRATMGYTQYKKLLEIANKNDDKAMVYLLEEKYGIPQSKTLNKLGSYLTALQDETQEVYDNADLIKKLLSDDPLAGHCCGLSSLWLYLKLLASQAVDADKPRDTLEWFYETQLVLSRWDDDKLSSLTAKEQQDIDRFLQLIAFFQDPDVYLPVGQGNLEEYLEDTKGRKLRKELSIAVELNCAELGIHLDTILEGRKAVHIVSDGHMVALMRQQDKYIVYNSSSVTGVEVVLDSSKKVAEWIFEAMKYDKNKPSSLGFRGFAFEISQNAYNTKKILAQISSNTKIGKQEYLGKTMSPIVSAAIDCQASLEYHVENGADINVQGREGSTALHFACSRGHVAIMRYLVEKGADINAQDRDGYTALHWACIKGNLEMVCYLVDKGAYINVWDSNEYTALHRACYERNLEVIRYLVKNGADINAENNNGNTALHLACSKGNLEIIRYLVENGADINAEDNNGNTALHLACHEGNLEIIRYLVEKGADINAQDNKGYTALYWAYSKGSLALVGYLLEKWANTQASNAHGQTPLSIASARDVEAKNDTSAKGYYASGSPRGTFFSSAGETPASSCLNNKITPVQALTSVKLEPLCSPL